MNTLRFKSGNSLVGIAIMVAFFFIAFWLFNKIWYLLGLVAPILLVVTLIINYKVVTNFLKGLWSGFRRDPVPGIVKIVLTAIFHPFVMAFLFFKAVTGRSIDKARQRYTDARQGILTEYEEVDSEPIDGAFDFQEPEVISSEKPAHPPKQQNPYENLFK